MLRILNIAPEARRVIQVFNDHKHPHDCTCQHCLAVHAMYETMPVDVREAGFLTARSRLLQALSVRGEYPKPRTFEEVARFLWQALGHTPAIDNKTYLQVVEIIIKNTPRHLKSKLV